MMRRALAVLLVSSSLVACGEDGGTGVHAPAEVLVVSGDAQAGIVGQPLGEEVTVRVVDREEAPIRGVEVSFATSHGAVSPATATTDGEGRASMAWTLGTVAGAQEAVASVDGLSRTINATAAAAELASLTLGPDPEPLVALEAIVQLAAAGEDAFGNAIADPEVAWSSTDGGVATVDGNGLVTAVANGAARIVATAGEAADTVDVSVSQVAVAVTITAPAERLAWSESLPLESATVDANGHEVEGATVEWSSADPARATVDADGLVTGARLGAVDIRARAGELTESVVLTVTPVPEASLTVGELGGCLIDESGQAYCWGENQEGEIGSGSFEYAYVPVPVAGGHTFVALAPATAGHRCGLTETGKAYCWGANLHGQLGDGGASGTNSLAPVAVAGDLTFRGIAAGGHHTCALTHEGKAHCWGWNIAGELGDGTKDLSNVPVEVQTAIAFDHIGAGFHMNCGLQGTTTYCWGNNFHGVIAGMPDPEVFTPTAVSGGHAFATIAVGAQHVCGMTTSGTPVCWGSNLHGEIAVDPVGSKPDLPAAVAGLPEVDGVATGSDMSCAIAAGVGYCWGRNTNGQLGDGFLRERFSPAPVIAGEEWAYLEAGRESACGVSRGGSVHCWGMARRVGAPFEEVVPTPSAVAGGHAFDRVVAGHGLTCGTGSGGAWCWGDGQHGELGVGDADHARIPVPVTGVDLVRVSAGVDHACGLTGGGLAYCWGRNDYGQLGDGTTEPRNVPTAVDGSLTFSDIAVGREHTCGISSPGGAMYCWGSDAFGQLGNGANPQSLSPEVVGPTIFTTLALGASHTCGISNAGTTYCWGENDTGQLGDDSKTDRNTPTPIESDPGLAGVTASTFHTCGWTHEGVAYCWGLGSSGQLGDGTFTHSVVVPTAVSGGHAFSSLDAGDRHTCGVAAGVAYCWGSGSNGVLGDGGSFSRSTPTMVAGGHDLAKISAGGSHSCAVTTAGAAYCWGYVDKGQIGDGSSEIADPTPVAGGHIVATRP